MQHFLQNMHIKRSLKLHFQFRQFSKAQVELNCHETVLRLRFNSCQFLIYAMKLQKISRRQNILFFQVGNKEETKISGSQRQAFQNYLENYSKFLRTHIQGAARCLLPQFRTALLTATSTTSRGIVTERKEEHRSQNQQGKICTCDYCFL